MDEKVVILSGAGLSASSGISTFRDEDGLWEKHNIQEICSAGCLDWNYESTINYGFELNYMLYNYLVYFQMTNKQQLGGFPARI